MTSEEAIVTELTNKFHVLDGKTQVRRPRRIFSEVAYADFRPILDFAKDKLGFNYLNMITGLDEGDNLALYYHLSKNNAITLNIKTFVTKNNPVVKTVTDVFPSADVAERELVDLLGFKVEGLAAGSRYPLTDDWPVGEFPLRKD